LLKAVYYNDYISMHKWRLCIQGGYLIIQSI